MRKLLFLFCAALPTGAAAAPSAFQVETPIASNFDINLALEPAWGTGAIPGIYSPDEGAFRFVCGGDGQIIPDDPLLFPGQPGRSHLHLFSGNSGANGNSTDETLRAGASNCNAGPYVVNHSAYWMPAMLDDKGNVVRPDLWEVYYKRPRSVSKFCDPANFAHMSTGGCAGLPNGIRFVFGWDPTRPDQPGSGNSWYCTSGTGQHYKNLDDVFNSGCGVGATLVADIVAGNCWDTKYLDTPDHRAHVVFGSWTSDGSGQYRCPATHPKVIPQTENKVMWTVTAGMFSTLPDGTRKSRVRLSSDMMKLNAKPGETLHADYWEKWDGPVKAMWMANCIEKGLNCSGGDLGNGLQIKGAAKPVYGWKQPNPLVPVPAGAM